MIDSFIQTLETLPPLDLKAVSLLKDLRPPTGEWFPTTLPDETRTQVIAATVELVAYTDRCAEMERRLLHLTPVPLSMPIAEFSL